MQTFSGRLDGSLTPLGASSMFLKHVLKACSSSTFLRPCASVSIPKFASLCGTFARRNLVERFFNKLKHFRAIATRYDKTSENFLAAIQLASARIWMRYNESVA
jgi:predicted transcriptional regulator